MGAPRAIALCECFLGALDFQQGDWTRAVETLRASVDRYHQIAAASGEALACQRLGAVLTAMGQTDEAMEMLERGVRVAERSTMRAHCQVRLFACLAHNRLVAGEREGARHFLQQGLRTLERHGACVTCNALLYPVAVRLHLAEGNLPEAATYGYRLQDAARQYSSRGWTAMAAQIEGLVLSHEGKADEAVASLREAMRLFEAMGQPYDAALTAVDLAEALRRRDRANDFDEARDLLSGAEVTFRRLSAGPDAQRMAGLLTGDARAGPHHSPRR
ncbi:MAG: tetratricopeptide repeat protein [bacterium]